MSKQWCFGWLAAAALAVVAGTLPRAAGQDAPAFPKPGPEFDILKKLVGEWDTTVRFGKDESKGTATYKMECNGMWLVSNFKGTFAGQPFQGRGLDSYDANKKKYVSVWVDSMAPMPMLSEGTYDTATKTLTMTSDYPGPDGKPAKHRMVSTWKDDDTIEWSMGMVGPDGKAPTMMTISYKRKSK